MTAQPFSKEERVLDEKRTHTPPMSHRRTFCEKISPAPFVLINTAAPSAKK